MKCKHGEFDPAVGCPQCIEEARREREAAKEAGPVSIVKVKFLDDAGEPAGRSYSYFTEEPLTLGDVVQVPVRDDHSTKAQVVEINVPEHEIAAFKDRVKLIPSGSKRPPTQAPDFIPDNPDNSELTEISVGYAKEAVNESTEAHIQAETIFKANSIEGVQAEQFLNEEIRKDMPELIERAAKETAENPPGPFGQSISPLFETLSDKLPDDIKEYQLGEKELPAPIKAIYSIEVHWKPGQVQGLLRQYLQAASLLDYAKKRVISTNADLKPAADDLAIILQCRKSMETRKAELVGPMRAELDRFYQAFNDLMAPVLEAEKLTKSKVAAFDTEQRRKAADAAAIEEEKAALARREAELSGTGEITVELGTAEAPPPMPAHVRTGMGTMSGRANWKARVVDFAALPDEYKLPNEPLLNAYARTHKGEGSIPGVEFFDDRVVTVRTNK